MVAGELNRMIVTLSICIAINVYLHCYKHVHSRLGVGINTQYRSCVPWPQSKPSWMHYNEYALRVLWLQYGKTSGFHGNLTSWFWETQARRLDDATRPRVYTDQWERSIRGGSKQPAPPQCVSDYDHLSLAELIANQFLYMRVSSGSARVKTSEFKRRKGKHLHPITLPIQITQRIFLIRSAINLKETSSVLHCTPCSH